MAKSKKQKGLSDRQLSILKYINDYTGETGRPPTIREIGEATMITSTSVVNYNLQKLVERGLVERDAEVSRGLRLDEKAAELIGELKTAVGQATEQARSVLNSLVRIPIMGDIVASEPLEVGDTKNFYEDLEIAQSLLPENVKTEELFALRVNGDSMIDAMINDGDTVIMRKANQARNGDMVAVWLTPDDTTTLKKFYHEGNRIRLQPANPTMDPIFVAPENVTVQGKVVMVVRQIA